MSEYPGWPYSRAADIQVALQREAERGQALLRSFGLLGSAALISVQREHVWGYRLRGETVEPITPSHSHTSAIRLYRGGQMSETVIGSADVDRIGEAIQSASQRPGMGCDELPVMQEPTSARRVVSFDPRLAEYVCQERTFKELAGSLSANTWHEAARLPGLRDFSGELIYRLRQTYVARKERVLSHASGGLHCQVQFNGSCGEEVLQVNAPQSFLPTALIGARTWRNSPMSRCERNWSDGSRPVPLVFHPRVMERLIRFSGQDLFAPSDSPLRIGSMVGCDKINLIDDPGLDGLLSSRSFDDLGQRSHRLALVLKGRVVRHLSRVNVGGGHHWRDANGALRLGYSSLLMNRGDVGFHRLLAERPQQVLVNKIGRVRPGRDGPYSVEAPILWGVLIDSDGRNKALPAGRFALRCQVFQVGGQPGILSCARLSHELHDTGSAILPYVFSEATIVPNPG